MQTLLNYQIMTAIGDCESGDIGTSVGTGLKDRCLNHRSVNTSPRDCSAADCDRPC